MSATFAEFLAANGSKDWLARNALSTAGDLLRVLAGTQAVREEGMHAAPGQTDQWDAVFASIILRKYAMATPTWTEDFPPQAVVTALVRHRGVADGPSWQVRKNLYLLFCETVPYPHPDVQAMALEEGVAPTVYRDILPAADLYLMKCYGESPREYWSKNAPSNQNRR